MRTTLLLAALALLPAVAFAQDVDLLFSARTLTCDVDLPIDDIKALIE